MSFTLTLASLPAPMAQALSLQPPPLVAGVSRAATEPWRFDSSAGGTRGARIVLGQASEAYEGVFDWIAAIPDFFDATVATVEMPAALRQPPVDAEAPRVASSRLGSL